MGEGCRREGVGRRQWKEGGGERMSERIVTSTFVAPPVLSQATQVHHITTHWPELAT